MELQRALEKLPTDQRAAIILVGLEGFSYEEAAAITAVAVGTMKSRLSRAREASAEIDDGTPSGRTN